MGSLILSTATRYLMPLLMIFSIFLLLRGHNQIGGGFVGGLVAAAAIILYAISNNVASARHLLRVKPQALVGFGLLTGLISGVFPVLLDKPFFTGIWFDQPFPVVGKIGTPLFFDLGVYLVMIGVTLMILFPLVED